MTQPGEHQAAAAAEHEVPLVDRLKAEQQKVFEARSQAEDAKNHLAEQKSKFEQTLRDVYLGKRVRITGPLDAEEHMIQDGFEMDQSYRSVSGYDGYVISVWAEGSGWRYKDQPIAYVRSIPIARERPHEVMVRLFGPATIEIVEESEEASTPLPTALGNAASKLA